jgi:hypothetical protein
MARRLVNPRRDKDSYAGLNFVVVEMTYGPLNFPIVWY